MKTRKSGAFTLIELLIVVAIIGILAAIAIPNFLQAQVRAKVSRAQNDMRAVALAFEMYHVDYGLYPWVPSNTPGSWEWPYDNPQSGNPNYVVALSRLWPITTPVEYLSEIFRDPFQSSGSILDSWGDAVYTRDGEWGSYIYDRQARNMQVLMPQIAKASVKWGLWSPGPDNQWQDTPTSPWKYLLYDPTNGTVSLGNIWRVGP